MNYLQLIMQVTLEDETFLFGQDNRNTITVDIIDPVIAQVSLNIPSKNIPIAKANDTVQLSYRVPHLLDIELATRVRFNGISEDTSSGTFDRSISYAVPSYRSYTSNSSIKFISCS